MLTIGPLTIGQLTIGQLTRGQLTIGPYLRGLWVCRRRKQSGSSRVSLRPGGQLTDQTARTTLLESCHKVQAVLAGCRFQHLLVMVREIMAEEREAGIWNLTNDNGLEDISRLKTGWICWVAVQSGVSGL